MTKLFDVIHRRGCEISEHRARMADPAYAQREDARHIRPGVVLGTEGPGGLQGFFEDLDFSSSFRPWWHTASLHVHWWMRDYGPRALTNRVQVFVQRGRRGWADSDLWNFNDYLAGVIRDGLRRFDMSRHGYPPDLTDAEWSYILRQIVDGMQARFELEDYDSDPERVAECTARFERAMELLATHWESLWD